MKNVVYNYISRYQCKKKYLIKKCISRICITFCLVKNILNSIYMIKMLGNSIPDIKTHMSCT